MLSELPISHGFFKHPTRPWTSQECQNLYPETAAAAALADEALLPTPGLSSVAALISSTSYACRGVGRLSDAPYFCNGPNLYRLESNETATLIGTIAGNTRVWMPENGSQLLIVTGGAGYIYDGTTLAEITDVDYDEANGVPQAAVFIDGYFVTTTDNDRVTCSNLNDGTTWTALDFTTAESSPDGLVAPFVYQNQLHVAGTRTIEQFTNIGGANFPFQRTNLFYDRGVTAAHSIVNMGDAVLFLGAGDNEYASVWALQNSQLQRIANHAVDARIDALTATQRSNVFAWSYMLGGHHFYALTLPEETLVYDMTTAKWHTRTSRSEGEYAVPLDSRCRINGCISAYGSLYVGDQFDGRIGKLDPDLGTEYDQPILRTFSTQPYNMNRSPFSVPYLEVGIDAGQTGEVSLEVSTDGGRTWSDPRQRDMGAIGEYRRRAAWRRLGRFRDTAAFRFRTSTDDTVAFMGLQARIAQ